MRCTQQTMKGRICKRPAMKGKEVCFAHALSKGEAKRKVGFRKYNRVKHGLYSKRMHQREKLKDDLIYLGEIDNLKVEISIARYITSLITLYLMLHEENAVEDNKGEIRLLLKSLDATTRMLIANKLLSPDGEEKLGVILDNALDELAERKQVHAIGVGG